MAVRLFEVFLVDYALDALKACFCNLLSHGETVFTDI
jgi:hypothetical protein